MTDDKIQLRQSSIRTYRKCPRRYQFEVVQGWKPKSTEAQDDGTLWHYWHAHYWEGFSLCDAWAALTNHYATIEPFQRERLWAMAVRYDHVLGERIKAHCNFAATKCEVPFSMPVINPATFRESRRAVQTGTIDGLPWWDDRRLVLEAKSTKNEIAEGSKYWTHLALDPQLSTYVLGAESLGHHIEGCLYSVIRKPALRPLKATPPESRKYTKEGKLYAAQRENDETPEEYGERYLEALTPEHIALREVPRSDATIKGHMADTWQWAAAIADATSEDNFPKNPDACTAFGMCPHWVVCSSNVGHEELGWHKSEGGSNDDKADDGDNVE